MDEYENTPIVVYGPFEGTNYAYFRVCPKCGRFVKADNRAKIPEFQEEPNATCKRCGRVKMPFCGWMDEEEDDEQ